MAVRGQDEFRLACVVADWMARALPARASWTHFPAGENRSLITGARLKRMGLKKGWPDYLVIYDRKVFGLELKAGRNQLSDDQKQVADLFHDNGAHWTCARSLEEVERFFLDHDVPIRVRMTGDGFKSFGELAQGVVQRAAERIE